MKLNLNLKFKIKDILLIVAGTFLLGYAFNVFFRSNSLVTGGVSGLSIIIEKSFNIDPSLFILFMNVILFFIGWYFLGNEFATKTVLGTFLFPVFVNLTSGLPAITHDLLLVAIFGSVLSATGLGLVFRAGGSTGGADIPPQILNKKKHIPVGFGVFLIDGIVVFLGGFTFGWENVLYALIAVAISSYVIDRVLLGFSNQKAVHIISDKNEEIRNFILTELERGVTILTGKGGYTKNDKDILLCVIENIEFIQLKNHIKQIDENAFLIVTNATEVHGEGFSR